MKKLKPTEKRKRGETDVEKLLKEKDDVESMIALLESDYRKADISEKSYSELKQKHLKRLGEINKKLKGGGVKLELLEKKEGKKLPKKEETEEVKMVEKKTSKSKKVEEEIEEERPEVPEEKKEEKSKLGFFKRLFGKKEETKEERAEEEVEEGPAQSTQEAEVTVRAQPAEALVTPKEIEVGSVEIEKLKVMIDAIREAKQATDETIRTLSESIGEIRSMVFQADAGLREGMLKMEKIEDDISEIKPQEIAKKFREVNDTTEKHQITLEKLEKKSEDLAEKINKVHEMLKSIGSIENVARVNKDIQKKLEDINEAVKYIERIGSKTEKIFLDLSKGLEDFAVYRAKQEDLDESLKEMIKSIDALNVKFESYVSKKDLEAFKEDALIIKKQIEEINKVLPIVQVKLPESIINLRGEREDILLFLDSLEEQLKEKKISREEYESVKNSNKKKLKEIEEKIKKEWEKIEKFVKISKKETPEIREAEKIAKEEVEPTEEVEKEVKEEKIEEQKEAKGEVEKVEKPRVRVLKKKLEVKERAEMKKAKKIRKRKLGEIERKKIILSELKKLK